MEEMTFLHMRCEECHTPVFASVALANQNGDLMSDQLIADDIVLSGKDELPPVDSYAMDFSQDDLGFERKQLDIDPYAVDLPSRYEIPVEQALTAEQIMAGLNPVSYDDVLDIHQFLATQQGNLDFLTSPK
jgi:hypothetical protein